MSSNVYATLAKRLRYAIDLDRRSLSQIARASGYSTGYISALYRKTGPQVNSSLGAIWAIAGALNVEPLWLLGSDHHPEPVAPPPDDRETLPRRFPREVWDEINALREDGTTWPNIAKHLRETRDIVIHFSNLRRAWQYRKDK